MYSIECLVLYNKRPNQVTRRPELVTRHDIWGRLTNRGTWFSHLPKTWQSMYISIFVTIRDYSSLFATIRHYSLLFVTIRYYSSLFATSRHYSLLFVTIRDYSSLFATIRDYSQYSVIIRVLLPAAVVGYARLPYCIDFLIEHGVNCKIFFEIQDLTMRCPIRLCRDWNDGVAIFTKLSLVFLCRN